MANQVFVGREQELAQLFQFLDLSLGSQGQVCFVTGEAGSGKTALVTEFARRAQERHGDLVVAIGQCDAHTGMGDPYLPFREVLGQLTGDVEAKLAKPGGPGTDQKQVFDQYTSMLNALAEKQPLLLILDDLHWADAGSTGLLFRLGRRIEGSHVLIVGTYRPEEVALERAGERHPLQKVLAEFKRYFGEISVDLDRAGEMEGQQFVDAVLATEPNCLGEEFRRMLFQRTKGHALFTIELLQNMRERGALVQDEQGRWLEGPMLDWSELPDRVEGIIEERIERLEAALRDILSVASVEGQDFTAQVIARVEKIGERELLRVLSQELEKRHRLVREREEVKLDQQFLARYQFAHALFRQYLYSQLGAGERRMLHGEVATLLEELYEGHTEEIAGQLARHYTEAGENEKAFGFLVQAGDAAARLYARAEARLHYTRALEALAQLPDTVENRRRRVDSVIRRVSTSTEVDPPEETLALLTEAERTVRELPGPDGAPGSDRVRLARVHYWVGWLNWIRNAIPEAIHYFSQVLPVAQEIGDPELLAMSSAAIGVALSLKGQMGNAEPLLRQGMMALERIGNLKEWVRAMAIHGGVVAIMGDYAAGVAEIERAIAHAREMGSIFLSSWAQLSLARTLLHCGDPLQAIQAIRKELEAAEELGLQVFVYLGHGHQALAEAQAGRFEAAQASMARSRAVAEQLGGRLIFADFFLAGKAEIALGTGRIQEALDLAQQAVNIAQETGSPAAEACARRAWGQVLASLRPPRWNEAQIQFAESLRLFESLPMPPEAAQTHLIWGTACRNREDPAAAREHWETAAALWEGCGITWELERVRALMETLPEA